MKYRKIQCLLLAAAGGMVEAFSLIRLDGVFSNVQAANLLLGALALVRGDWKRMFLCGVSVAAYIVGIILCRVISQRLHRRKWQIGSLILSEMALITAALTWERCAEAAVFLLALLCGSYYEDLCSHMEKLLGTTPKVKYGLIFAYGAGVLAGALLLPAGGGYVLAGAGIVQLFCWFLSTKV